MSSRPRPCADRGKLRGLRAGFILFLATMVPAVVSAADASKDAQWLQFRGDRALAGRSPLKGSMEHPQILWKHDLAARETLLEVQFDRSGVSRFPLPSSAPGDLGPVRAKWGLGDPLYDLDDSGIKTAVAPSTRYKIGEFLPGQPGLQKVEFESAFQKSGTSTEESVPVTGRLYKRVKGDWQMVWESPPIPLLYTANPIVGDFDNDGRLEVAVVPWHDLWLLDLATGQLKTKCRFTPPKAESGRAYGWLGGHDLDGDGRHEFIIIGDFQNFVSVLGWKGDRLKVLWDHLVERGITGKETVLRPGAFPVQDIDGDGKPEIVVSLFNAKGDNRWHVIAFDGLSGKVKLDLHDRYLTGATDVDGDGTVELFCTYSPRLPVPVQSELNIVSFKGGKRKFRWRTVDAAFVEQDLPDFPLHINSGASTGRRTLLTPSGTPGTQPVFLTRSAVPESESIEVSAWRMDDRGRIRRLGRMEGPNLEALVLRMESGEPSALVQAKSPVGSTNAVRLANTRAVTLAMRRTPPPLSTPVAGRLQPAAPTSIVVQDATESIVALAQDRRGTPTVKWRLPGRGIATGSLHEGGGAPFGGVVLADLAGDGSLAVLIGSSTRNGAASLSAVDARGQELWTRDFPRFAGAVPTWNIGGLTWWSAGHFRSRGREDVIVSLRRSTMHTDETFLLAGRNGRTVWHRTEGGHAAGDSRACGGSWMAIYDHNGNGLDDALCLYPDLFMVMQGSSGKLLVDRHTNKDIFSDTWSFYAISVVAVSLKNGRGQILYGASTYMFGLLQLDGTRIWGQGPKAGTPAILPGIGDANGDGRLELLSPGHCGKGKESLLKCHDARTGKVNWQLPLPGRCFGANNGFVDSTPMTPAVADLNGDGRDEAVFAIDSTLMAVGEIAGRGAVLWKLDFPGKLGPVAIADVAGNDSPQMLVVCEDGFLYGLGGPAGKP